MIVSAGRETSSCVGVSSNLAASVAGIDFQNIFIARIPGLDDLGFSWAVVLYLMVGLKIHMLRNTVCGDEL
jgi:hypothetical protein